MLQSVKISELPSADTLTEDDLIVVDQPDDTKKATLFQVFSHLEDVVGQSTLAALAQPDGASKSYSKNAPVSLLLRRNIFEYMTEADRNTISATVGVEVVVDYALQAAIDDGVMGLYFPPCSRRLCFWAKPGYTARRVFIRR